jgi:hypothetical protein
MTSFKFNYQIIVEYLRNTFTKLIFQSSKPKIELKLLYVPTDTVVNTTDIVKTKCDVDNDKIKKRIQHLNELDQSIHNQQLSHKLLCNNTQKNLVISGTNKLLFEVIIHRPSDDILTFYDVDLTTRHWELFLCRKYVIEIITKISTVAKIPKHKILVSYGTIEASLHVIVIFGDDLNGQLFNIHQLIAVQQLIIQQLSQFDVGNNTLLVHCSLKHIQL